jgi:putative flippase GtrA
MLVITGCMLLNYICLKIFVESMGWYPTLAQLFTTCIVIVFNYFSQRNFSFRTQKLEAPILERNEVLRNSKTDLTAAGNTSN